MGALNAEKSQFAFLALPDELLARIVFYVGSSSQVIQEVYGSRVCHKRAVKDLCSLRLVNRQCALLGAEGIVAVSHCVHYDTPIRHIPYACLTFSLDATIYERFLLISNNFILSKAVRVLHVYTYPYDLIDLPEYEFEAVQRAWSEQYKGHFTTGALGSRKSFRDKSDTFEEYCKLNQAKGEVFHRIINTDHSKFLIAVSHLTQVEMLTSNFWTTIDHRHWLRCWTRDSGSMRDHLISQELIPNAFAHAGLPLSNVYLDGETRVVACFDQREKSNYLRIRSSSLDPGSLYGLTLCSLTYNASHNLISNNISWKQVIGDASFLYELNLFDKTSPGADNAFSILCAQILQAIDARALHDVTLSGLRISLPVLGDMLVRHKDTLSSVRLENLRATSTRDWRGFLDRMRLSLCISSWTITEGPHPGTYGGSTEWDHIRDIVDAGQDMSLFADIGNYVEF